MWSEPAMGTRLLPLLFGSVRVAVMDRRVGVGLYIAGQTRRISTLQGCICPSYCFLQVCGASFTTSFASLQIYNNLCTQMNDTTSHYSHVHVTSMQNGLIYRLQDCEQSCWLDSCMYSPTMITSMSYKSRWLSLSHIHIHVTRSSLYVHEEFSLLLG